MLEREGLYIYGVIATNQRREFGSIGIGERGDGVYTFPYQDLAAIVSQSPLVSYPTSRANLMAHMKVLEKAMNEYTVLPLRFCTIANDEDAVEAVLQAHYQEFIDLLRKMAGKIELGIRVYWTDLNVIFSEIIEENRDIKALREELINEKDEQRQYAGKIKIGQMVQNALEEKKKREAEELLEAVRPFSLDYKENQVYGDMNLVNAAFLVNREMESDFYHKVQELEKIYGKRKKIKYIGLVAPYNFVNVDINA